MAKQNNNPKLDSKRATLNLIKEGLKRAESSGNYRAINETIQSNGTPTLALGVYQFVPSKHWNDIVDYARTRPEFKNLGLKKISGDHHAFKTPEAKAMYQRFLNNRSLQDGFFDSYADKKWGQMEGLYKQYGNRLNLRRDQVFAMIHHQGFDGASTALFQGKVNYRSPDGTSGDKYLKDFNSGVYDYVGIKKDKKGNYVGTVNQRNNFIIDKSRNGANSQYKSPTDIKFDVTGPGKDFNDYKDYVTKNNKLRAEGKITDEEYNKGLKEVQDRIIKNGNSAQVDELIRRDNFALKTSKYNKAQEAQNLINIFNQAEFGISTVNGKQKIRKDTKVNIYGKDLTAEQKQFILDNPKLFKRDKFSNQEAYTIINPYDVSQKISNAYKEFGMSNINPISKKNGELYLNDLFKVKDNPVQGRVGGVVGELIEGTVNKVRNGWDSNTKTGKLDKTFLKQITYDSGSVNNGLTYFRDLVPEEDYDNSEGYIGGDDYGDWGTSSSSSSSSSSRVPTIDYSRIEESNNKIVDAINNKIANDRERDAELERQREQDRIDEENEGLDDNLNRIWDRLPTGGYDPGYNPDDYKHDLPITDVANSLAGIIIGDSMAKTDLPERNEQISQAYQSYFSEMAEISKRGMSIEDEAAAKAKIAESYQLGFIQLQKASGGNRNTVLGNLAALDSQKANSLMELAVNDSKMRFDGLKAYGEAAEYMSNFEAQKDIANNEREYQIAQEKRRNGGDLAAAAWQNLGESLVNYENNKPGSLNHMEQTLYLRNAFKYDPNLKDDGTGNTKYTKSWHDKTQRNLQDKNAQYEALQKRIPELGTDEQRLLSKYFKQTGFNDLDGGIKWIDYMVQNRGNQNFSLKDISDPTLFYNENIKSKMLYGSEIENSISNLENNPFAVIQSPMDLNVPSSDFYDKNPNVWQNVYNKTDGLNYNQKMNMSDMSTFGNEKKQPQEFNFGQALNVVGDIFNYNKNKIA